MTARHRFTAEGEAIAQALQPRGVPIGSGLEYVDLGTIAHALGGRR